MLTNLFDAIESTLRDAFTVKDLPSCEKYPQLRKKIATPALLIEATELGPGEDPGTEELALTGRFIAYAVIGLENRDAPQQAANLAASVALRVKQASRFGQPVGPAKFVRSAPDDFRPDLVGYAVWAVEWTHEIRLGDSVWDGSAVPVTEVYVGLSPDIGTGNEANYMEVTGG